MIPFVGPSYQLKTKRQGVQRSINLMPTQIESGSGKAAVYLQPVPGLVLFSGAAETPPPENAAFFMDHFLSDSCNYAFVPRSDGTFLLITDSFGDDISINGDYFLKLVEVDESGAITGFTQSEDWTTPGPSGLNVYEYGGFLYAGPVQSVATDIKHLIKINPDTLAITSVYSYNGSWLWFVVMNDPSRVLIDSQFFTAPSSETEHFVVDLDDGSTVTTITPEYTGHNGCTALITQSPSTSRLWAIDLTNDTLVKLNETTGALISSYARASLLSGSNALNTVYSVGGRVVLFGLAASSGEVGLVNETTGALESAQTFLGIIVNTNQIFFSAGRNAFFFAATENGVAARVYGYYFATGGLDYTTTLELDFIEGGTISAGTGNFAIFEDDSGFIYVNAFTGYETVPGAEFPDERYRVFRLNPP